jgi:probable phosphoglycerate mutase
VAAPLYLIRHTGVTLVAGLSPGEWPASADGVAAAERLATAPALRTVRMVASSPEVKALATAEPIARQLGLELKVEPDLREVSRPPSSIVPPDVIRGWIRAYLSEGGRDGWEPRAQARARVTSCIDRLRAATAGPIAVVSHGLVLTLYRGDEQNLWQSMPLPAVAVSDAAGISSWLSVDEFLAVTPSGTDPPSRLACQ